MYEYTSHLVNIHDGDTIRVIVELGLDVNVWQTVRFYGLNAPELNTPAGKVALAYVQAWFSQHAPNGTFTLRTIKDHREKYGRYLGTVIGVDGANLNEDLISSGNAVPYMVG